MRSLTVKKGSGTNYTTGWHTLTISNAKYGDWEGNKFLDIWFDFVFYTKNKVSGDDREYLWITARDEKYDHAKDRTGLLPPVMSQDYREVIAAAKKKGFEGAKILVIGSPGSGKTYSLQTLVNGESK